MANANDGYVSFFTPPGATAGITTVGLLPPPPTTVHSASYGTTGGPQWLAVNTALTKVYMIIGGITGGGAALTKLDIASNTFDYTNVVFDATASVTSPACVLPNEAAVYATYAQHNTIYVLDPATGATITTIAGIAFPFRVTASPDSSVVYVVDDLVSNNVFVVSTATHALTRTIPLPTGVIPVSIAIHPSGNPLYIGTEGNAGSTYPQSLVVLDVPSGTVTGHFPLGTGTTRNVESLGITPDGKYVVAQVATATSVFCVFDTVAMSVLSTTTLPSLITAFPVPMITTDGSAVYFATHGASYSITGYSLPGAVLGGTLVMTGEITCGVSAPVPPPYTPPTPPTTKYRSSLFVPRKGLSFWDVSDFDINWNAIERWASNQGFPIIFPFRDKRMPTERELDANWHRMEIWVASSGIYPPPDGVVAPLIIPRKNSLDPSDVSVNFLRIQDWANGQ